MSVDERWVVDSGMQEPVYAGPEFVAGVSVAVFILCLTLVQHSLCGCVSVEWLSLGLGS